MKAMNAGSIGRTGSVGMSCPVVGHSLNCDSNPRHAAETKRVQSWWCVSRHVVGE